MKKARHQEIYTVLRSKILKGKFAESAAFILSDSGRNRTAKSLPRLRLSDSSGHQPINIFWTMCRRSGGSLRVITENWRRTACGTGTEYGRTRRQSFSPLCPPDTIRVRGSERLTAESSRTQRLPRSEKYAKTLRSILMRQERAICSLGLLTNGAKVRLDIRTASMALECLRLCAIHSAKNRRRDGL